MSRTREQERDRKRRQRERRKRGEWYVPVEIDSGIVPTVVLCGLVERVHDRAAIKAAIEPLVDWCIAGGVRETV